MWRNRKALSQDTAWLVPYQTETGGDSGES